jgi:proliferating cell nuclear antigen
MFMLKVSDGKMLKDLLSAASTVVDEATFRLEPEGLRLCALDPSRVALVEVDAPKSAFDEYQCSEPFKLCVSLSQLLKVLKRAGKGEAVEVALEAEKLRVTISGGYTRSFTLPTLQPSEDEPPAINVQFTAKAKVDSVGLKQAIEDVELVGDMVTVQADADRLCLEAAGQTSNATIQLDKGSGVLVSLEVTQPSRATYSLNYLAEIVKAASAGIASLELASDMPLKIEYQSTARLTFHLAPRVEPV